MRIENPTSFWPNSDIRFVNSLSLLEFTCPKSFGAVCSVAGVCDTSTGQCICDLGRHGSDCSSEYFFRNIKYGTFS